jgi:hypothetical protein
VLQFYSGSRLIVELFRLPDGSWRGACLGDTGFEARLIAETAWRTWPHADGERVLRSAEAEIAVLLDPSLFASGFDPDTGEELQAALSLFNRLFDDVPEQLAAKLATMPLSEDWRAAIEAFAKTLRESRDARMSRMPQDLVAPGMINPQHYTRIF